MKLRPSSLFLRFTLAFAGCIAIGLLFQPSGAAGFDDAQKKKPGISQAERMKILKMFVDEFVAITPGEGKFPKSFQMGSVKGPANEQPVHKVTMKASFAMAKYEVPQNLYEAVMGSNPSVWGGPRNSVEMVSWIDSMRFCARATQILRAAELIEANESIRLPTEAEWEYCCRAGSTTAYSFGEEAAQPDDAPKKASLLDPYGWHTGNAAGNDPPVGALKPNAWGLYDLHGYLWEYVSDTWHGGYQDATSDGSGWGVDAKHGLRVMRSGSWRDHYSALKSTTRWPVPDHVKSDAIGFRCVKATTPKK